MVLLPSVSCDRVVTDKLFLAAMALCSLDFRAAWDCVLALSAETATLETTPAFRSPHYEGEDGSGLPRQRSLWDHVTVCSFGAFL